MASVDASTLVKSFPFEDSYTRLAYTHDGKHLFTAGNFAHLRVYETSDQRGEVEARTVEPFAEPNTEVLSIDCSPAGDVLVACYDGNVAKLERTAPYAMNELVTRCNLIARDARFNPQGTKCAVASDELVVKLIDVRDTSQIQLLNGHTKAVRAVSWHPEGNLLMTSGSDGTLKAWDLTSSEPLCVKTMEGIIPVEEPESMTQCSAVWHPQGSYFVAATKAHEIAVIQRDTWARIGTFATEGHDSAICALAWSSNGNYLASAGNDGQIIVWDAKTKSPVTRTRLEADSGVVTELAWQPGPGGNAVASVTSMGVLFRWHNVISTDRPHPTDIPRVAPRERQASVAPSRGRGGLDEEDLGDGDSLFGDDDNWLIDDVAGDTAPPRPGAAPFVPPRSTYSLAAPRQKGQPAFQPGATAWKDKRRYLAFNDIGVVHAVDRDAYQVITVDFHDQGAHRGYHFEDYNRHSMVSLGLNGALFAGGDNMVLYKPYETWTSTPGDWTVSLPKGEAAVSVAMGRKIAIVATDAGYLRFISAGGLQVHLVDFGRDVVCSAMGAEFGLVIHRASVFATDDLSYTLFDLDTFEVVQNGSVPATGETTLKWVGFTDDEMPAIYKSNGVLSVLDRSRRPWQARWMPIFDTKLLLASETDGENKEKEKEKPKQSYWPVWATSTQLHHIILKGEERQPQFPTPLVFAVDYRTPAIGVDSAEGKIQDSILRSTIMTSHLRDGAALEDEEAPHEIVEAEVALDKELLKLMQMACKADRLERALEIARLLTHPASLDAAVKLAAFFRLGGLQDRIERLRERQGPSQPEKRESRWAPLADERTISGPVSNAPAKRPMVDLLAMPFETEKRARAASARPVEPRPRAPAAPTMPPRRSDDSGLGSSEGEPIAFEEDDEEEERAMDVDEAPHVPAVAIAAATSRNLFAKKAKPPAPAAAPVAAASSSRRPPPSSTALKKSDSFFVRVEEQEKAKGPRQSTLFGSKPPPAKDEAKKSGRGRKRKTAEDGEDDTEAAPPKKQTLADMFGRAGSKASLAPSTLTVGEDEEEEDESQLEETQLVESPQSLRRDANDVPAVVAAEV